MFPNSSAVSRARRHIRGMTTHLQTGNGRAIIAQIHGDVIHLRRCAKVFIAPGMGDEYSEVEPPELAVSYIGNLLPFKQKARS